MPSDSFKKLQVSGIVESKSVDTLTTLQKQDGQKGLFVDRGVGSTKFGKSSSACSLASGLNFGTGKVSTVPVLNQLSCDNKKKKQESCLWS